MEEDQEEVTTKKTLWNSKANIIGIAIIIALFAFIIGNRWGDIYSGVTNVFVNSANSELPDELDYSSVDELYDALRRKYDGELNLDDIMNGLKKGLAQSAGDPYTIFLSEKEAKEFKDELNGTFTGIGAELGAENDRIVIIAPLDGFPAQKAGLRAGDIIVQIDGEDAFGISIEEAVTKIRGEKGTDVTLSIARDGKALEITITRDEIVIPSVTHEIREDGVGYLKISRFAQDTASLSKQAADEFVSRGVEKVILDLRNNGGGFLDAAVDIAGLWLPSGSLVVEQRAGDTVTQSLKTRGDGALIGLETVLLINQGSASASEIVAGALQDYEVATLVGETSFGKGSVQALEELGAGGVLKVTIARWFTPEGNNIDQEGIEPDVVVEFTEEDYENDTDPQLDEAVKLLNQ